MKVGRATAGRRTRSRSTQAIGPERGAIRRRERSILAASGACHGRGVAASGVTWFEEPVSSEDLSGLRLVREQAPPGMEITAGEYGYETVDFRRLLDVDAVDVLMADATRCWGFTGFLAVDALCQAARYHCRATRPPTCMRISVAACGPRAAYRVLPRPCAYRRDALQWRPAPSCWQPRVPSEQPGMGLSFEIKRCGAVLRVAKHLENIAMEDIPQCRNS